VNNKKRTGAVMVRGRVRRPSTAVNGPNYRSSIKWSQFGISVLNRGVLQLPNCRQSGK
jgi:hypothetical protein